MYNVTMATMNKGRKDIAGMVVLSGSSEWRTLLDMASAGLKRTGSLQSDVEAIVVILCFRCEQPCEPLSGRKASTIL